MTHQLLAQRVEENLRASGSAVVSTSEVGKPYNPSYANSTKSLTSASHPSTQDSNHSMTSKAIDSLRADRKAEEQESN